MGSAGNDKRISAYLPKRRERSHDLDAPQTAPLRIPSIVSTLVLDHIAMPNLLSIPYKKAQELKIKDALYDYIQKSTTDTHPDAFKWDIKHWTTLRSEATAEGTHLSKVDIFLRCIF
jgi:hypothetical protein